MKYEPEMFWKFSPVTVELTVTAVSPTVRSVRVVVADTLFGDKSVTVLVVNHSKASWAPETPAPLSIQNFTVNVTFGEDETTPDVVYARTVRIDCELATLPEIAEPVVQLARTTAARDETTVVEKLAGVATLLMLVT
jgi:hypothetical protein